MRATMEKVLRLRKASVKKSTYHTFVVAGGEAYRGTYPNGQILKSKEKERYPQWLESQEERRAKIEEMKRNREILSNAPPEQEVEPAEKNLKKQNSRKMCSMNIILAIRCISVLLSMKSYLLMMRE